MKRVYFSKGKLQINGYDIIVMNGWLGDKYSESDLKELNNFNMQGVASVPYRQQTLLVGEFSGAINEIEDMLSGNATFTCLGNDGRSIDFNLNLFGRAGDGILLSEIN